MLIYATDHFVLPLPPGHRFPMAKYARLRERVAAIAPDRMREPPAATDAGARAGARPRLYRSRDGRHARRESNAAHRVSLVAGDGRALATLGRRDDRRLPLGACAWVRREPGRRHAPRAPRLRRGLLRVQRRGGGRACDAGRAACCARADRRPRRAPGRRHRRDRRRRPDDPHAVDPRPQQLSVPQRGEPAGRRARRRNGRRGLSRDAARGVAARAGREAAPTSRSTSPAPIRMSATGWGALRSARRGWRHGTRTSSIRCARPACPWRSRWPAATRRTSTTSSTYTSRRCALP